MRSQLFFTFKICHELTALGPCTSGALAAGLAPELQAPPSEAWHKQLELSGCIQGRDVVHQRNPHAVVLLVFCDQLANLHICPRLLVGSLDHPKGTQEGAIEIITLWRSMAWPQVQSDVSDGPQGHRTRTSLPFNFLSAGNQDQLALCILFGGEDTLVGLCLQD